MHDQLRAGRLARRRFSLLRDQLATVPDVVARNRAPDERGDDPVLSTLSRARFDQVWLMAVDSGEGVSPRDLAGLNTFRGKAAGAGARDHMDMGLSLRKLDGVGQAHLFHRHGYCERDRTSTACMIWRRRRL